MTDGGLSDVRKLLAGYERLVVLCLPVERAVAVSAPLSAFAASALNLVMGIWAEGTGVDLARSHGPGGAMLSPRGGACSQGRGHDPSSPLPDRATILYCRHESGDC